MQKQPLEIVGDQIKYLNDIVCDYCGKKVPEGAIITSVHFDQAICEECWEEKN